MNHPNRRKRIAAQRHAGHSAPARYITKKLNNGLTVLAWGVTGDACKYVNRTQAENSVAKHGGRIWQSGPVFYVVLNGLPLEQA